MEQSFAVMNQSAWRKDPAVIDNTNVDSGAGDLMTVTHFPPSRVPLAPLNLESIPNAPSPRSEFSHEVQHLTQQFAARSVRISEVLDATEAKGFHHLLLLIALLFLTPIPLPGLSAPFGLVIVLVGAQLALGRRPWLPERIVHRELPARFIAKFQLGAVMEETFLVYATATELANDRSVEGYAPCLLLVERGGQLGTFDLAERSHQR